MRLNKASILSACLLALRVGVTAAPTENVHAALIVDEHQNTTVAEGHFLHGVDSIEFPVPVAELERRARGGRKGTSRKPSKTTKKKTGTKKKTPKKKKPTNKKKPTSKKPTSKKPTKTKSAKDPYGSCKPKKGAKGAKGAKGTKTKGKKGVKRDEEGFTPISDMQYHVRNFFLLDIGSMY